MSQAVFELFKTAFLADPAKTASASPDVCKAILQGDDASALALFIAARRLLGEGFVDYEPETLELELAQHDVVLSAANQDALHAAMTLRINPAFYWDANVFENTVMAFNHTEVLPDIVQQAHPAEIAWAVFQAHAVVNTTCEQVIPEGMADADKFDFEAVQYTALACLAEGMIVLPEQLAFAEEALCKHTHCDPDLVRDVKKAWEALDKKTLPDAALSEGAVDVQLAHMASIVVHYDAKMRELLDQLSLLGV